MAIFNELLVVSDPDQLGYNIDVPFATATEEIVIDTTNKTIALKVLGNLTNSGATFKAVYSKLKDAWRVSPVLIKFPFPIAPITDEQFEVLNGWNWDKVSTSGTSGAALSTVELLRTSGWSVVNTAGAVTEYWAAVVTLGSLGDTDQVYYQQVGVSSEPVNFKLTGKVNQAVQIVSDPNGDGNYTDGFDRRTFLKIFVREWGKVYAQTEIADIGVSQLNYQAYRYPLTNSSDLKITHTTVQIDADSDGVPDTGVYTNVSISYLRSTTGAVYNVRGDYTSATVYAIGDVVKDTGTNRYFNCIVGYTSNGTQPSANATNWASYEGERLIGSTYYPYTVIIDGDTSVPAAISGSARSTEIYEAVQYKLRQGIDIDSGTGSITGRVADSLLRFVGDTLVTSAGVYVESFNTQDANIITLTDALGTPRTFPFVAALTVNFGANLQNDQFAKYWVFFTDANGAQYGSSSAIVVKDAAGIDMAGDINPAWPTKRAFVSHSFDYDSNVQGGRTGSTDAPVTVVGLGLTTGQYVSATGVIARSIANSATLTSALERNYTEGTV